MRREVLDSVERIDQYQAGQAERHRVDGEIPAREVGLDIVTEPDLGLAGVGQVGLRPVRGDLETATGVLEPNGPEPLSLGPHRLREVRDERLDLVGGGIRGEIDVHVRIRFDAAGPPGDAVAHRTPDEKYLLAGSLEELGNRSRRLENRPKPLGNAVVGAHPASAAR